MQGVNHPVIKDVVLVGAGHSHVTVLRMFGMKPIPGVRLTLITREVHTPYSGMLPGLIAGHYGFDDAHIDTGPLTRFAGARLYQDEVVGLDLAGRQVICRHRPPVPYDLLSLNIGSTPNTADVPGASEHAIPVKPIDGFLSRFEALMARVLARKGRTRLALVGAGAGGVELLLSVEHRLRQEVARSGLRCRRTVVRRSCPTSRISCRAFRRRFAHASTRSWQRAASPSSPARRSPASRPGASCSTASAPVEADEILWTTQAAPARWLAQSGIAARRQRLSQGRPKPARRRACRRVRGRRHHRVRNSRAAEVGRLCRARRAGARGQYPPHADRQGRCGRFARSARRSIWSRPASATRSAPATGWSSRARGYGAGRIGSIVASCASSTNFPK